MRDIICNKYNTLYLYNKTLTTGRLHNSRCSISCVLTGAIVRLTVDGIGQSSHSIIMGINVYNISAYVTRH